MNREEQLLKEIEMLKESRAAISEQEQRQRIECNRLRGELAKCQKRLAPQPKMILIFDEATGYISATQGGVVALWAFEEFPDRPKEFKSYAEAKAYVDSIEWHGQEYELQVDNSDLNWCE